jgi:hypothetical protein
MIVGVISVGVMTVGVLIVGVMTLSPKFDQTRGPTKENIISCRSNKIAFCD